MPTAKTTDRPSKRVTIQLSTVGVERMREIIALLKEHNTVGRFSFSRCAGRLLDVLLAQYSNEELEQVITDSNVAQRKLL